MNETVSLLGDGRQSVYSSATHGEVDAGVPGGGVSLNWQHEAVSDGGAGGPVSIKKCFGEIKSTTDRVSERKWRSCAFDFQSDGHVFARYMYSKMDSPETVFRVTPGTVVTIPPRILDAVAQDIHFIANGSSAVNVFLWRAQLTSFQEQFRRFSYPDLFRLGENDLERLGLDPASRISFQKAIQGEYETDDGQAVELVVRVAPGEEYALTVNGSLLAREMAAALELLRLEVAWDYPRYQHLLNRPRRGSALPVQDQFFQGYDMVCRPDGGFDIRKTPTLIAEEPVPYLLGS
mmetsp:Transcript_13348/g.37960  ORF Transcript_13348/g.37960 Transcript_13348/m.37960 type:complete len:291 (-) Transcript_13348:287-1159(-)